MMRMNAVRALFLCALLCGIGHAQEEFDPIALDPTEEGPWSDIALTTVVVPQVVDGSIKLDGKPGTAEYGGFEGTSVIPGTNAWNLNWPPDRSWDDADDSSFTFYLAHDTDFLYVGVDVKDDVVTSDDPNNMFWRDDAIEIVTDVWNDNYDNNTDNSNDAYGGHIYANYEGRFSAWNEETEAIDGGRWSSAVDDWTYAEDGDIWGFGEATETGWNMELRMHKRLFEDPDAEIKLVEGARMGFNIGLDDDDKRGTGPDGNMAREQDLELQYFWANRLRYIGWNADVNDGFYSDEEIAQSFEALGNGTVEDDELLSLDHDWAIDGAGRLSHGGAGEIIFGGLAEVQPAAGDCNGDGVVDASDLSCACSSGTIDDVLAATGLPRGDLDGDGSVGFLDFLGLANNFGTEGDYTSGDIDCSGDVGFLDFLALANQFGATAAEAASVPEPSSLTLLMLGLLAISKRRKNR